MPTLDRDGEVYLLDLGDGENRFTPDWVGEVAAALDQVAGADGPRALVTRAAGKIWSNGLDLDWMGANPEAAGPFVDDVHALLARALSLPVPTVAACQGHVFAAGAMLALAHDLRVMRADRGWFCLPEVDIRIPFTPGMSALIQGRLSHRTAHEAMTTARRYPGPDALAAGIVDAAVDLDDVVPAAVERARALAGTASPALGTIKEGMYAHALQLLRTPAA
ncbi:MAG TPA: enoyl-CoA hydratase-related protein [Mycobacteriales bacterium]|nr:enoyl-CoA hydratase-related protein [Mycobacteriales bacterium]